MLYFFIVSIKVSISICAYSLLLKTRTVLNATILDAERVVHLAQSLESSLFFHRDRPLYRLWLIVKVVVNIRAGYIFLMRRVIAGGHRKPHLNYVLIVNVLFLI